LTKGGLSDLNKKRERAGRFFYGSVKRKVRRVSSASMNAFETVQKGVLMKRITVVVIIVLTVLAFFPLTEIYAKPEKGKTEFVLLLHGMGRTRFSMRKVARFLEDRGYKVMNISCPSTTEPIPVIADTYVKQAIDTCMKQGADKIHVVTHSLGGIVIRQYLQNNSLPDGSRIVMLGPPNKGSQVADFLMDFFLYKWAMGDAGQSLGTNGDSLVNMLGPVDEDIGIIAGTRTVDPISSLLIPGADDGKVSVDSTMLDEMTDFITIPKSHPFMASSRTIMHQIEYFLENGKFDKVDVVNPDLS
jgi:hypothetical protein